MKNNNKGFSLVELIVVIAIMAILAAIAIPTFAHFITKANEASDAELLHNINYIFNTACIENGVDVKDVTAAEWDMEDMLVTSVKVNGVENADIVASFATHFDLTEEEFKLIQYIYFDKDVHAFVESDEEVFMLDGTILNISEEYLAILRGENTFSQLLGADGLLTEVGTLERLIGLGAGEDILNEIGASEDFMDAYAGYLGLNREDYDTEEKYLAAYEAKLAEIEETNPNAKNNAMIMYAASHAANATDEQISGLFTYNENQSLTSRIEGANDAETMTNAALAYGMYTAYAKLNNIDTSDPANFSNTVNSKAFADYYISEQGQADLKAYQTAMNIVGDNTGDSEITGSILENGITDNGDLADLMEQIMGK